MKRRSTKRARQEHLYMLRRRVWLLNKHCERCGRMATEVHHKAGRIGVLLLDETKWCALCHDCHVHVTEHPAEAYEQGFSLHRGTA